MVFATDYIFGSSCQKVGHASLPNLGRIPFEVVFRKRNTWNKYSELHQEEEYLSIPNSIKKRNTWNKYSELHQEEEYLEQVFRTPPIPVQIEQKSFYSGRKVQSSFRSVTTIPAILALPAIPLAEME